MGFVRDNQKALARRIKFLEDLVIRRSAPRAVREPSTAVRELIRPSQFETPIVTHNPYPCSTPGCDGSGNTVPSRFTHRSIRNCPKAHLNLINLHWIASWTKIAIHQIHFCSFFNILYRFFNRFSAYTPLFIASILFVRSVVLFTYTNTKNDLKKCVFWIKTCRAQLFLKFK